MALDKTGTLALLIDGENVPPRSIAGLLAEIATNGVVAVKRIYGDWTSPHSNGWKECLLEHSIQPVQQFTYTTGKNATDSAMIIDAMDLLHTGRFAGFCIVSSDSDFTRLAARIREQGLIVYGYGERKTPRSLVTACNEFVYLDALENGTTETVARDAPVAPTAPRVLPKAVVKPAVKHGVKQQPVKRVQPDKLVLDKLTKAIIACADKDGRASLSQVGKDIKAKTYGYARLSSLIKAWGIADIERTEGTPGTTMVKLKPNAK